MRRDRHFNGVGTALTAAGVLMITAFVCESVVWPDWDTAWLLTVARRIRDGAALYSNELIEVNPPTIIDFARLALTTGEAFGVTGVGGWRLLVFGIELLAVMLSFGVLRRVFAGNDRSLLAPASLALATALACLPGASFGQREHLILLLCAPYVLSTAVALDTAAFAPITRGAHGVLLAVALSIKPHYVLVPLCLEATLLAMTRRPRTLLRPETSSALVAAAALAVIQLIRYPDYLTFAVPFAVRFYQSYTPLTLSPRYAAFVGLAALVVGVARYVGIRLVAPTLVLAAGVGATLAMLAQGKGWEYHFVPARGLLFLAAALALILITRAGLEPWLRQRTGLSPQRIAAIATLAMILPLSGLMVRRAINLNDGAWAHRFTDLRTLVERSRPEGRPLTMASLSLELFPAFPVIEVMGGQWVSRYSCLWTIPAIEAKERAGGHDSGPERSGRQGLIAAISEDLAMYQPTFVLVEEARSPMLDEIVSAPDVNAALRPYRLAGRVDAFGLWVREQSGYHGQNGN